MATYYALHSPRIRWCIEKGDASKIKLSSLGGCRFLNPAAYSLAYQEARLFEWDWWDAGLYGIPFSTRGLLLESPTPVESGRVVEFIQQAQTLCGNLRYVSKQTEITHLQGFSTLRTLDRVKKGAMVPLGQTGSGFAREYYTRTHATLLHLKKADRLSMSAFEIPVHEQILLDAIEDHHRKNYRKSVLYAAMSVEVMLTQIYQEKYEGLVKGHRRSDFRIVQDSSTKKCSDAVYETLDDRGRFADRLHSIPLYLFKRSLLLDDKALYDAALNLYQTRNRIVHVGDSNSPSPKNLLPLTTKGSSKALLTAIELFEWMGIQGYRGLESHAMIPTPAPQH